MYNNPPQIPPKIYAPRRCLAEKNIRNSAPNQYSHNMLNRICKNPACINIYVNSDHGCMMNCVSEAGNSSHSNTPPRLRLNNCRITSVSVVTTKNSYVDINQLDINIPLRKASLRSVIICTHFLYLFSPVHYQYKNRISYHPSVRSALHCR